MKWIWFLTFFLTFSHANPILCAYKDKVLRIENNTVFFSDGSTLLYDKKNKTLDIQNADIEDMIKLPYFSKTINDAGRYRNEEFFKKIYGSTKKQIENNLVHVIWLKNHANKIVRFNKQNSAAKALQRVSNELDKLDNSYMKYLLPLGGTYVYRKISQTKRLSLHSFGIAIDLNTKYGSYWKWQKVFKNQIPQKIIDIFEKNGFIWGGRWKHFDTFHFEYRPEFKCK